MRRKKDDVVDLAIKVRNTYDCDLQQAIADFIKEINREMQCLEQDARIFNSLKQNKQINSTRK